MLQLLRSTVRPSRPLFRRRVSVAGSIVKIAIVAGAYWFPPAWMEAHAQTTFTRLFVFGDSYADNGNVQNIPFTAANYPSTGQSSAASAAIHPFVVYPVWLQSLLGLSNGQVSNYAIGGSTTQVLNVAGIPFSLPFQMAAISGRRFAPTDLVTLSIGGNDALYASGALRNEYGFGPTGTAFGTAQAISLASQSTSNASGAINQLVAAGARNLVIAGFSSQAGLPITQSAPHPGSLDVYAQNYFTGLQTALAPLASSGVRIFLFDEARMIQQIGANLGLYGFQSYANNPAVASLFQPDGVHPTSAGFLIEARYMTNLLGAPDTVAAQANLGQIALDNFFGSMFQRLDANRRLSVAGTRSLSVYMTGDYASGTANDRYGASGFNYQLGGATIGADYRLDPHLTIGGALNYLNPTADLNLGRGHIDLGAYQLGGYASLNSRSWFADLVLAYGYDSYRFDRPGIIDTIDGKTGGNSFGAGFKGGYLFDVSPFRVGPIIGLGYANSGVGRYTETGDPLLTFSVSQSNLEALIGSAGVQVRTSFAVGAAIFDTYLNLTAEHDFMGGDRTVLSVESQAPLLPIYTTVPGFGEATYGKVVGGISTRLGGQLLGGLNVAGTFGREAGNDFAINGQLMLAF